MGVKVCFTLDVPRDASVSEPKETAFLSKLAHAVQGLVIASQQNSWGIGFLPASGVAAPGQFELSCVSNKCCVPLHSERAQLGSKAA